MDVVVTEVVDSMALGSELCVVGFWLDGRLEE